MSFVFKPPFFIYTHLKIPLEFHFICLSNKEFYCIFKTCCIICFFSQNIVYFIILSFSVQTVLKFFINLVLNLARPTLFQNCCVVLCIVYFVLFYVLFVCKCVLPPGDNSIAVNKYIVSYNI